MDLRNQMRGPNLKAHRNQFRFRSQLQNHSWRPSTDRRPDAARGITNRAKLLSDAHAKARQESAEKGVGASTDTAKLREHLQDRDARVGKAIGELQAQVKDLRKQVGDLRSKLDKKGTKSAEKKSQPKTDKKSQPKKDKKAAPDKEEKASSISLIHV